MPPCNEQDPREITTRAVVEKFVAYWSVQDVPETAALFAEDACSEVHFDHPEVGMSGTIHGREKIAEGLYENLAQWNYIRFEPKIIAIEGNTGKVQVEFEYQHAKTGLPLASTMRMVVVVTGGLISRIDCYHDGERVAAYMALVRAQQKKDREDGAATESG